jgi:hypothetical protein
LIAGHLFESVYTYTVQAGVAPRSAVPDAKLPVLGAGSGRRVDTFSAETGIASALAVDARAGDRIALVDAGPVLTAPACLIGIKSVLIQTKIGRGFDANRVSTRRLFHTCALLTSRLTGDLLSVVNTFSLPVATTVHFPFHQHIVQTIPGGRLVAGHSGARVADTLIVLTPFGAIDDFLTVDTRHPLLVNAGHSVGIVCPQVHSVFGTL